MSEMTDKAIDILLSLARAIDPSAEVELHDEGEEQIDLELFGDGTGRLIGKHGATLDSLQYLTNRILQRHAPEGWKYVVVDTEGYRERRRESMVELALDSAQEVRETGKPARLEFLSAADRRQIHMALRDEKDLVTESHGEDPDRILVISLARNGR